VTAVLHHRRPQGVGEHTSTQSATTAACCTAGSLTTSIQQPTERRSDVDHERSQSLNPRPEPAPASPLFYVEGRDDCYETLTDFTSDFGVGLAVCCSHGNTVHTTDRECACCKTTHRLADWKAKKVNCPATTCEGL
jgi:hypothetical protein